MRGIILAAGEGRRMGLPKVFLRHGARSLVTMHVDRLIEVGCTSVTIVTQPAWASDVRAMLVAHHTRVHVEAAITSSQGASLAAALRVLPAGDDTLVVTPVDLFPADVSTYASLVVALEKGFLASTPTFHGHGGHPVLVKRAVLLPYESSREAPRLRDVLDQLAAARTRIPVSDPKVRGDFDTRADFLAATSSQPFLVARAATTSAFSSGAMMRRVRVRV